MVDEGGLADAGGSAYEHDLAIVTVGRCEQSPQVLEFGVAFDERDPRHQFGAYATPFHRVRTYRTHVRFVG